jgi:hypothetical protein
VALACSIALHEIAAGLIPTFLRPLPDQKEVVERVAIIRVSAKATPTPTPRPTPPPPHAVSVLRNNVTPTLAPVVPKPEGKSARKEAIKHAGAARPKPPKVHYHTIPIWDVPTGGQGAGAGRIAGAGSLGNGTNGTGTGNEGTGAGGGGAPCGAVDFETNGDATYNDQTREYDRKVKAIVHYADGSSETVALDWTWHYKTKMDDPFANAAQPEVLFQFPPPALRASEPPPVQYIMQYSRESGTTKLRDDCPNIPPPPTPGPRRV